MKVAKRAWLASIIYCAEGVGLSQEYLENLLEEMAYYNAAAEKLLLKFPDKQYDLLAYCDLLKPGKVKPTPNVKVCFANYNYQDYVMNYGAPYISSSFDSVRKRRVLWLIKEF